MNKSTFTTIAILLILFISTIANAQRTCGADEYHKWQLENDQAYIQRIQELKELVSNHEKSSMCTSPCTPIVVPIAIHFNSTNPAEDAVALDCSNANCLMQIIDVQIQELNAAFSATSGGAAGDYQKYLALNAACPTAYPLSNAPTQGQGACISFCLATMNHPASSGIPNGQPAVTVGQHDWPSAGADWAGYLNVFVSDSEPPLGVSPYPGLVNGDGVHVHPSAFGGLGQSCTSGGLLNSLPEYNTGGTTIHEFGHYFGLLHTFDAFACATDGDMMTPGPCEITDTPNQQSDTGGVITVTNCVDAPQSCPGQYHAFYSYMDYTDDVSMAMFTADQSLAMNWQANNMTFKSNVCDVSITDYSSLTPICNGILPVELVEFSGRSNSNGNLLTWVTETEILNKGFILERSKDGFNFEQLTFVEGAGTSNSINNYDYLDDKLLVNEYFYRLVQIDYDGNKNYSKVVNIKNDYRGSAIAVYPSLFNNEVNVEISNNAFTTINYEIFNAVGQLNSKGQLQPGLTKLDLSDLGSGIYLVRFKDINTVVHSERIVKLKN